MRTLLLAAVTALGVACVRADAPDKYVCYTAADCPSGDTCTAGTCLAPGECLSSNDCTIQQVCDTGQGRCVAAECWPGHEASCGDYACVNRACKHSCSASSDCQPPLVCRIPVGTATGTKVCGPAPLPSGHACTPGDDCGTLYCCNSGGNMVCSPCLPRLAGCEAGTDCAGGACCSFSYVTNGSGYRDPIFSCTDSTVDRTRFDCK
jgi:hypothetical protein